MRAHDAAYISDASNTPGLPSLRIWGDGSYWCQGCQTGGTVKNHPEVCQLFVRTTFRLLEQAGQLRLPGIL